MRSKIIDNRYEVVHVLGQGIRGEVYKVVDLSTQQHKALKILTNLGPDAAQSTLLKEEFRRLTKLKHLHIVPVYDFGFISKGTPYFTMEYMAGGPLSWDRTPYNESLLCEMLGRICLALQYIHSRGYIHGDIKPDNVLLGTCDIQSWKSDQKLPLKIADFSFAESGLEASVDKEKPLTGTVPFLAPEKFFSLPPDYRSDLYSLGVLLYYLSTGSYPFKGKDFSEYVHNILTRHPVPPSRLNREISERLEFIIVRLLEKEPLKRFQSAQEILNLLGMIPDNPGQRIVQELSECAVINDKFIGRESEMSLFRDLQRKTEEGQGQVLLIYGESGIGRSQLVREMKTVSQVGGFKVVLTRCEPEYSSSFRPFRDILTQLGMKEMVSADTVPATEVQHLLKFLDAAEEAFNDRTAEEMWQDQGPPLDAIVLFEECYKFLETLSASAASAGVYGLTNREFQPLLLIIEDCHLAHATLLDFFAFLVRNCETLPLLLCLTFCDDDLVRNNSDETHPLFRLIEANSNQTYFHSMRLARLTLEETSGMVTNFLEIPSKPGGFVKKIHQLTAGIPLHIHELLRFMLENNILSFEQGNWWISDKNAFQNVPQQLNAVLEKRYERLSEVHKKVLQRACFLPEDFQLEDLVQLTGKDPHMLAEILDDFILSKIMDRVISRQSVCYRFSHPAFRQLLLTKIKGADKVDLHLKTALILEQQVAAGQSERCGLLSFHFQAAADSQKARHYALRAAEYASRMFNFEEEVTYLERARSIGLPRRNERQELELTAKLGQAYLRSNRYEAAALLFNELNQLKPVQQDRVWASQIARSRALAFEGQGDYRSAQRIYADALTLYGPDEICPETIQLKYSLGWVLSLLKEYKKAQSICSAAVNDAKAIKSEYLTAKSYNVLGKIAEDYGNYQSAEKLFQKAFQIYRSRNDEQGIYAQLNNLGTLADKMGDARKAVDYHNKSLGLSRKHHDLPGEADSLSNLAAAYGIMGDWEQSLRHFQQALNIFKRLGNLEGQAMTHHNLGELFLRKGDYRESHQNYNLALKMREKLEDEVAVANTRLSLASLAILENEYASALDYLSLSQPVFRRLNLKRHQTISHRLMAEIYLKQENVSHAIREINRARTLSGKIEDLVESGNIHRLLGEISLKLGDTAKAQDAFQESLTCLEKAGASYELGLTYLFLAEQQMKVEKLRQAGFSLEKASELFQKLGTPQLIKRVDILKQELNARLQPLYFHLPSDQEQLKSLIRISHLINSIGDLDQLLEKILDCIISAVKADRGAIFLKEPSSNNLRAEVIRNLENETIFDAEQLSATIMNNVVLRGEPVYITDTKIDTLSAHSKSVALYGIVAIMCVPLKVFDDLIGVVYIDSRSMADIFLEKDLHFVAAFANIAALALANGLERRKLKQENIYFRSQTTEIFSANNIIFRSKAMHSIMKIIAKIASSSSTVLLTGESGTGKELIAKALHTMSSRNKHLFLPFFCGNAPETMIDSELFGHVKGAFSGAIEHKKGIFEEANGGTVFLDEISEIGPQIQAKLLRFLQDKMIKPLGSNTLKNVNVRIIAATNKDLEKEIKSGSFRSDLFYRLRVIQLHLPPLRERKDDIPPLAYHFLQKYNMLLGKDVKGISKIAMQRLGDYSWPGNVRELENQIEMAVNLAEENGFIDEHILTDEIRGIDNMVGGVNISGSLKEIMARLERELIVSALLENKGNKSRAARRLGITRQCLNQKLKLHKIY